MGNDSRVLHFMRTHSVFKEVRVVTNDGTQGEQEAHAESSDSNNVAKLGGKGELFAIRSGNWLFHLLTKRAEKAGLTFRLNVVENGCINPHTHATKEDHNRFFKSWKTAIGKATFAWANAGHSFFLQIDGAEDWGLKPLGIELVHGPKSAKRANEITRQSEMFLYSEDPHSVRVKVRAPKGITPAGRDGMNYISESFAIRMLTEIGDPCRAMDLIEEITSGHIKLLGTFRLVFGPNWLTIMPGGGLIKGHAIIRPDKCMEGYDIITVPENVKDEIRATESFIMATAEVKHPTYQATWDIQRMVMNPQVLTHEHRFRDLDRMLEEIHTSIDSGEIPEWLLLDAQDEHENDFGSTRDDFADLDSVPLTWQAAGLDIRTAQNVVRMAMGAVVNRMGRFFEDGCVQGEAKGYARRMWLPKSNAFVAYFISHGSLTKVGNWRTRRNGDRAYMVRGIGLVLPDNRIEELLALMGGADFDDSAEVNLIKVWSSDKASTAKMRKAGVIGKNDPIPESAEDASYMACLLRSPNGIGEYAMVQMEDILKAPWQFRDLDNVEVVDLATLPTPSTLLSVNGELKSDMVYSRQAFTVQDAYHQIMAQQFNPGIGRAANAMMAWVGSGGVDLPPSLKVGFEQLVDGVQQLSDPAIFTQVLDIGSNVSSDAVDLLYDGKTVDEYLIRRFAGDDMALAAGHSYEGEYTEFQEKYRAAILEIHNRVMQKSLQMRHVQPVVERVRQLPYSAEAKQIARDFVRKHDAALREIDKKFGYINRLPKGLKKTVATKAKFAEMRATVDVAVAELEEYGEHAPKRAVAVWRYILRPEGQNVYGHYDRLIFQPGNGRAIMNLIIEGLNEYGIIDDEKVNATLPEPEAWGDEEDEDQAFFDSLLSLAEELDSE